VLGAGYNLTIKYESDGTSRPYDTMEAYFLSDQDRDAKAELIGDVNLPQVHSLRPGCSRYHAEGACKTRAFLHLSANVTSSLPRVHVVQ